MPDRPAAELQADAQAAKILAEKDLTDCRDALALAEQALADIKALHTLGVDGLCCCCWWPFPCRTVRALRASQGGQTTAGVPTATARHIEVCCVSCGWNRRGMLRWDESLDVAHLCPAKHVEVSRA